MIDHWSRAQRVALEHRVWSPHTLESLRKNEKDNDQKGGQNEGSTTHKEAKSVSRRTSAQLLTLHVIFLLDEVYSAQFWELRTFFNNFSRCVLYHWEANAVVPRSWWEKTLSCWFNELNKAARRYICRSGWGRWLEIQKIAFLPVNIMALDLRMRNEMIDIFFFLSIVGHSKSLLAITGSPRRK